LNLGGGASAASVATRSRGSKDDTFCGTGPEADSFSERLQDAWIAFARTGNPTAKCAGDWPEYGNKRMTMIFGKESHVEAAPFEAERAVWETIKRSN